jgi:hypothetical protein
MTYGFREIFFHFLLLGGVGWGGVGGGGGGCTKVPCGLLGANHVLK